MFHEILYKLGASKRNPSLKQYYNFLKTSEKWSREELLNYQLDKCRTFLTFVYEHSDYYHALFNKIDVHPSEINSIVDLKKIPCVDKAVLLENIDRIHTNYNFNKKIFSETSGTSGQPLKFYKNEEWDSHNRATMFRGYSWYGIKPWDKNGYFWGYNTNKNAVLKTKLFDFLQNRFRLFSYNENEIQKFLRKLPDAKFLTGYSSMIYEVSKLINSQGNNNKKKFNLKMIKGTAEKVYDSYQEEAIKAFGRKIINEYGAAEAGLIAFECEKGSMHINIENVVVEIEDGEILVTNLLSKSFPIIRYKLGDSVTLADPSFECKCGRKHPVIIDILGRVGKKVIGYQQQYPSLTFYYVFKNLVLEKNLILNYQAVQNVPGKINLKIEQQNEGFENILRTELVKYFSDDIEFAIEFNQKLHTMDGKLKDFITNLN